MSTSRHESAATGGGWYNARLIADKPGALHCPSFNDTTVYPNSEMQSRWESADYVPPYQVGFNAPSNPGDTSRWGKLELIHNASERLWLADSQQNKINTFRIGSSAANQFNLIHGSSSANFLMFDFHVERLKHEDVVAKWTTLTNTFR